MPALIAFARNAENKITGYQQIILDPKTNNKADIDVPKRSVGKITGSFVDLGYCNNGIQNIKGNDTDAMQNQITIIAEGIETGLSIKQALSNDKVNDQVSDNSNCRIICALGISNIKNYHPEKNEKIIIASDNDGVHSVTDKVVENAKTILKSKGAFVEIVKSHEKGDFNDILKSYDKTDITNAERKINNIVKSAVEVHNNYSHLDTKNNKNYRPHLNY